MAQQRTLKAGDNCCPAPGAAHTSGSEDGAIVGLIYTSRAPRSGG